MKPRTSSCPPRRGLRPLGYLAPSALVVLGLASCGELPTTPPPSAEPPVALQFDSAEVLLEAFGQDQTLAVQFVDAAGRVTGSTPLEWESDNPGVATVDSQGRVVAHGNGVARISARTVSSGGVAVGSGDPSYRGGRIEASLEVRVHQRVATIELSSPRNRLRMIGELMGLEGRPLDPLGSPLEREVSVSWRSESSAVVTVDAEGRVQAVAEGVSRILAEAEEITGSLELLVDPRIIFSACVARGISDAGEAATRSATGTVDACGQGSIIRRVQP